MEEDDEILVFDVPPGTRERLDKFLASVAGEEFSRSRIQGLVKAGRVAVISQDLQNPGHNQQNASHSVDSFQDSVNPVKSRHPVAPNFQLRGGERIEVSVPPPVPAVPVPQDIPLNILFEDPDILVVDKPAALVVHPAPGHFDGTLVNAILHHCPDLSGIGSVARPGIVHRLDADTSGVMIVAKTDRAMRTLAKEFASHANIKKTYLALVHGSPKPSAGRIESLIGRSPYDRKKMAIVDKNGKFAATNYRILGVHAGVSLVRCEIETGRTHQIRVHLASLGTPIVFDSVYGQSRKDALISQDLQNPRKINKILSISSDSVNPVKSPPRQLLHAWRLELKHPVTREPLSFTAPLPDDFYLPGVSRRCAVSLGSNLGDRRQNLENALARLARLPATRLLSASEIIETKGVDVPDEFKNVDFLNQAAIFETLLSPEAFSEAMHGIEDALGRRRGPVRNVPRTIDIDLIDFEGVRMDTPALTLPHPRAAEREFVTAPLRSLGWHLA